MVQKETVTCLTTAPRTNEAQSNHARIMLRFIDLFLLSYKITDKWRNLE